MQLRTDSSLGKLSLRFVAVFVVADGGSFGIAGD